MTTRATRYDIEATELIAWQAATREVARPNGDYVRYADYREAAQAVVELANYVIQDIQSRASAPVPQCATYRHAVELKTRYEEEGTR